MQQAVLITAYKNFAHLNQIIDFFNGSSFIFFIHIDKKSKITAGDLDKLQKKESVCLVSQHYSINWGGINHLKAILLLVNEARKSSSAEYFHLITGHDFPIKSPQQITSFLTENRGKEFMEVNPLPYDKWMDGGLTRITLYNIYDAIDGRNAFGRNVINKLKALQIKLGISRGFGNGFPEKLYGGSTYWTLSRNCIEYVFLYMQENPEYLKRFKYTFCSEEIFFQTIICNSPFKDCVINDSLRFIIWENRNGNFPANLDESDFDSIIASNALFARKFESPVSEKLLEKLKSFLIKEI